MVRRIAVLFLALVMGVMAPALLPDGWSGAHAKKSRSKTKSEQAHRKPAVKTIESQSGKAQSLPVSSPNVQAQTTLVPTVAPNLVNDVPLTLSLSTDRPSYKQGELMTVAVVANAACNLTLISIDSEGFAVVVFPNEYEPNNMLNAGVPLTVPRVDAAYQLRAKGPGTETLLGICSPPGTRPRGIVADYERFRFTLLGDWPEFTTSIQQREIEIVKFAAEAQRKRRRRAPPLAPLLPPTDPSSQGRSILLVKVDEAP
ncbi:MAG: DUF4384 domain-containing protein [Hyphomicrobium sp.]